jgi:hypothetical protein
MAITQSLTVSRSSGDLVMTNTTDLSAPYVIAEGGLSFPDFAFRLTYLPDNDDVPGKALKAATLDQGTMPLLIDVRGSTLADLQANRRALEAAFGQFSYTVTLTIGTETETYNAFPHWPKWGVVDSGRVSARIFRATLSVPVNPMGA